MPRFLVAHKAVQLVRVPEESRAIRTSCICDLASICCDTPGASTSPVAVTATWDRV